MRTLTPVPPCMKSSAVLCCFLTLLAFAACDPGVPEVTLAAHNDFIDLNINQSTLIDVLANDTAPAGARLTLSSVASPTCGTIVSSNAERGEVVYKAPAAPGPCRFEYTASAETAGTATAAVIVTVAGPGAPPVAVDDHAQTAAGEGVAIDVLANDQGSGLSIASFSPATNHGGAVARTTDGRLYYVPAAGFRGTDTFNYRIVNAAGLSSQGRVAVQVQ